MGPDHPITSPISPIFLPVLFRIFKVRVRQRLNDAMYNMYKLTSVQSPAIPYID